MGKTSQIQWCDATWNIARGCTKVNEDCKFCYMMRDSLNGTRYNANQVVKTKTVFNLPDRLKEPGTKVFVSSLTDWCHEQIDAYRPEMWAIIKRNPHLTYQMLTKRWGRLHYCLPDSWFTDGPMANVWLGISAGSQRRYDEAMLYFKNLPAAIKWVSLEPLTGPITNLRLKENGIKWVVVGGESGNDNGKWRYRQCEMKWIADIVRECREANVAVFVKQLGTHLAKTLKMKDRTGGDIDEWIMKMMLYEHDHPERIFSREDVDWIYTAWLRMFPGDEFITAHLAKNG